MAQKLHFCPALYPYVFLISSQITRPVNIQKLLNMAIETGDLPLENHMILHFVINIVECYFARGYIYFIYIYICIFVYNPQICI